MGALSRQLSIGTVLMLAVSIGIAADHELERTVTRTENSFGRAIAPCGDIDDDGHDDIVVGAEGAFVAPNSGVGTVDVISGKDGTSLKHLEGGQTWGFFGSDVAGAGDVNDDGVPDILVGARKYGLDDGAAFVFSGKDWSKLYQIDGPDDDDEFGFSVSGVGDVNDDGHDDFIVGMPQRSREWEPGAAFVYSGKDGKELYKHVGDRDGDDFGHDVTGGHDFDGDGRPDYAVGAPIHDGGNSNDWAKGLVRLYSGKTGKEIRSISTSRGDKTGWAIAGIPDLDGDGCDDLVAGAPGAASGWGRVFVYSGKDGTTLFTLAPDEDGSNGEFGDEVASAGDVDGDGTADILVGARLDSENNRRVGAAYVFSGKTGNLLATHRGTDDWGEFGFAVAGAGDVNQDGRADYAIGSYGLGEVKVYGSRGPGGTLTINGGAAYANERDVTLGLTWVDVSSTVSDMRLRNAGDAWGAWTTPVATQSWTLPAGDGVKTVEAEFRNLLGDVSATASAEIELDETPPTVTIEIDSGADHTASDTVSLALVAADGQSGLDALRFRDGGDAWDDWSTPVTARSWTLPGADGFKTVEVQARDLAGNVSAVAADSTTLDRTGPTGSVTIAAGADFTATPTVQLTIPASDVHSGVAELRVRNAGSSWAEWKAYADPTVISLPASDGEKTVEVQLRDLLGNESPIYSDSIVLDMTAPTIQSLAVNDDLPYVVPGQPIEFEIRSSDGVGGSGVKDLKVDYGAGSSDWTALAPGLDVVELPHPGLTGVRTATVTIRDGVGNQSESPAGVIYLIEENLLAAGGDGRFTGLLGAAQDVDTVRIRLVKGDILTAKIKARSGEKKKSLLLSLDLVKPDGTRVLVDRYPADAKKPVLEEWVVTETGDYLLVVRRNPSSESMSGTFKLKVKVKQSRTNRKAKGSMTGETLTFPAVEGATLKATLQGEGLTAAGLTLTGPEGAVVLATKEKNGKVTILPTVLDAGTGQYAIRLSSSMDLTFKWKLSLPGKTKGEITE